MKSTCAGMIVGITAGVVVGTTTGLVVRSMTAPRSPARKKIFSALDAVSEAFSNLAKFVD